MRVSFLIPLEWPVSPLATTINGCERDLSINLPPNIWRRDIPKVWDETIWWKHLRSQKPAKISEIATQSSGHRIFSKHCAASSFTFQMYYVYYAILFRRARYRHLILTASCLMTLSNRVLKRFSCCLMQIGRTLRSDSDSWYTLVTFTCQCKSHSKPDLVYVAFINIRLQQSA